MRASGWRLLPAGNLTQKVSFSNITRRDIKAVVSIALAKYDTVKY